MDPAHAVDLSGAGVLASSLVCAIAIATGPKKLVAGGVSSYTIADSALGTVTKEIPQSYLGRGFNHGLFYSWRNGDVEQSTTARGGNRTNTSDGCLFVCLQKTQPKRLKPFSFEARFVAGR